jgi:CHASE2 domain-containing sensor protein
MSKLPLSFLVAIAISCNSQVFERNIVLIDVGHSSETDLARQIQIINTLNPAVMSICLRLARKNDESKSSKLFQALVSCKKIVMLSLIESFGSDDAYVVLESDTEFVPRHAMTGFSNIIHENDALKTVKRFAIEQQECMNDDIEYHFSVRTVLSFDSLKAMAFVKKHPQIEDIDYKNGKRKFKTFSSDEVTGGKLKREDIEGKIVMVGFLGQGERDMIYTPLNKKTLPYKPDMYELEYLANIVSQVLENK